ncbi:MAG TPA: alpha-galactosidase [Paraburkholderia sp.]|jgi:alpha-galactosidase|nr:alpha-galactosidase [Paraburkholderia sp.]
MRQHWVQVIFLLGALLPAANPALAENNGLALTPPMGWNSWNRFGCSVTEDTVKAAADALVSSGLREQGYQYVTVDDCWMAPGRDAKGNLVNDPTRFPGGIKALADYVHRKGLKFGLYESPTQGTCQLRAGSYGHETQDASTFAAWGVDYLKYDWCQDGSSQSPQMWADFSGRTEQDVAQTLFSRMSGALQATGRPIAYSLSACCVALNFPSWAGNVSNSWRTSGDINDSWSSMVYQYQVAIGLQASTGPGGWSDPDMLEVGNGGMSDTEYRTHFSLWAMLAAPLNLGNDLATMTDATRAIIGNAAVIAIDQDALGVAARRVASSGDTEVLSRPLANGDRAVALLNKGGSATTLTTNLTSVGLPASAATLTDLWSGAVTQTDAAISAMVPAHGTALYRVHSPAAPAAGATEYIGVASGRCLDVNGGYPNDGTNLIIWDCHGSPGEQFAATGGTLRAFNGEKCVRPAGGGLTNATLLEIGACTGSTDQRFTRGTDGTLHHTASGLCVDVNGAATAAGTSVMLWSCHGGSNQQWARQ